MNSFGISEKSYELITASFLNYPEIENVVIFGSRAKGTYKHGSDIDLAIYGENCSQWVALELKAYLNNVLTIPYKVDVVDYNSLEQKELKEHINRVGKKFC